MGFLLPSAQTDLILGATDALKEGAFLEDLGL